MSEKRLSRRDFLKGAAAFGGGAFAIYLYHNSGFFPGTSRKPFRSIETALNAQYQRRLGLETPNQPKTPLQTFLDPDLPFNRFSISNNHLWKESENLNPAPPQFATKPWDAYFERGEEYVPLVANNRQFTSFREDRMGELTRVFDRTVWAKHQKNQDSTVILETFTEATPENVASTVEMLAASGCTTFIVGNETNIEDTPWFNKFDIEYAYCKVVWDKLMSLGINDFKVGPAAPAFLGGAGEYQRERLKAFNDLAKGGRVPVNIQPVHQYGPVDTMQDWISNDRKAITDAGLSFPYYFSELGSPAPEFYQEDLDDSILAEGYPFQAILKANALGVNHITYHTLYDSGRPGHSLAAVEGGKLIPKSSYRTVSLAGEFLENIAESHWEAQPDFETVTGTFKNHLYFKGLWNSRDDREVELPNKGREDIFVIDAFGEIVPVSKRNAPPKVRSYLGGPMRILISQNPL